MGIDDRTMHGIHGQSLYVSIYSCFWGRVVASVLNTPKQHPKAYKTCPSKLINAHQKIPPTLFSTLLHFSFHITLLFSLLVYKSVYIAFTHVWMARRVTVWFDSHGVLKQLQTLDTHKGAGPDMLSPALLATHIYQTLTNILL